MMISTSKEINPTKFRMGQPITVDRLEYLIERTPLGRFVTHGVTEGALQNGIEILDGDGNVDANTTAELEALSPRFYKKMVEGIGASRGYGIVIFAFITDLNGIPRLYFFAREHIDYELQLTTDGYPKLKSVTVYIPAASGRMEITFDGKDEGDKFLVYSYRDTYAPYQAKSYLEPIYDFVFIYAQIYSQIGVAAVRYATGLRKAYMRQSLMQAKDANSVNLRTDTETALRSWGQNLFMILPKDDNGNPIVDVELDSPAQMIDFLQLITPIMYAVSTYTKIPYSTMIGNEIGMRSAETNRDYALTVDEGIQKQSDVVVKWILQQLLGKEFNYRFLPYSTMTETDEESLKQTKLQNLQILANLSWSFDEQSVLDYLDIPLSTVQDKQIPIAPETPDTEEIPASPDEEAL